MSDLYRIDPNLHPDDPAQELVQQWIGTVLLPVEDAMTRVEWEATKPVYGEASEGEYLRGLLFGAVGEDKVPVMDNRIGPNFGAAVGEETDDE